VETAGPSEARRAPTRPTTAQGPRQRARTMNGLVAARDLCTVEDTQLGPRPQVPIRFHRLISSLVAFNSYHKNPTYFLEDVEQSNDRPRS
jgi:hypothetical protein